MPGNSKGSAYLDASLPDSPNAAAAQYTTLTRRRSPLRLDVPDGAYTTDPRTRVVWWSGARYFRHIMRLYDHKYASLRRSGRVEAVSRETFAAVIKGLIAAADFKTGRDCVKAIGHARGGRRTGLCADAKRTRRTVQRALAVARALQAVTVVVPGRLRSRAEQAAGRARGDYKRGWASVYALHPSPLSVDNPDSETHDDQDFGTPPVSTSVGRRASVGNNSPTSVDRKKKSGSWHRRRFEPAAIELADALRSHHRMPRWIRRGSVRSWAAVLTPVARAGWTADDVHAHLESHGKRFGSILSDPANPHGYCRSILGRADLATTPPAQAACAERAAIEQRRICAQRELRRELDQRNAAAASVDSPARKAALSSMRSVLSRRGRTPVSSPCTSV